ncbi:MAG: DNA polymerase I, partial [Bifidobacteriaceae bacterium]|nr:DNA polymerase I [Bifidobacteriaceae bacterium]
MSHDAETDPTARLLLIDGHSMAFRAFYAFQGSDISTATGQPVGAVFGFTSMLISLLKNERPTHVGVAFDVSRTTFRTRIYPEYKGTRGETPEEFIGQVPLIQEVLDSLGIRYTQMPDYEADDILATWTAQGRAAGMEVLVCSGDRDTYQLIDDRVTVLFPRRGVSQLDRMTPEAVAAKYGVDPAHYPDMAALVGEQSDNLPGVPLIGPKKAAQYLNQYGGLEELLAHAQEIKGKTGENLRASIDQVRLNRRMGTPVRDLALPLGPADLALGPLDRAAVHHTFDTLEFAQLRGRLFQPGTWPVGDAGAPGTGGPAGAVVASVGAGPVELETVEPGALGVWIAAHDAGGAAGAAGGGGERPRLGVAVAGRIDRGQGDARTLTLGAAGGAAVHVDLAEIGPRDEAALAAWLGDPERPKAVFDAKAAWHELRGRGLELKGVAEGGGADITLAAYLCFPDQRGYDLDDLSRRFLGNGIDADDGAAQGTLDLGGAGGEDRAAEAEARAAVATARLATKLEALLAERGQSKLLSGLELPIMPILARMEDAGIAVDTDRLDALESHLEAKVEDAARAARDAIGRDDVNLSSPKQLQEILFGQLGMKPVRRTKTGYSTDAESLAELAARTEHPFLIHLLEHRDHIQRLQAVQGLKRTVGDDARIHTTFQQTVAATGRLSSADPNLQNIPVRTET